MGGFNTLLGKVVTQIVNPIILLLSAIALVVFAWGIFEFVRGAADDKSREQGRKAIFWGLIGFVIIFGAYGIIDVALRTFGIDSIPTTSGGSANNIKGVLNP